MKSLLLSTALLASLATPGAAATLVIELFDNGAFVDSVLSTNGAAHLVNTTAPGFTSISVDANGRPLLPGGDLSSTTLNVSALSTTIAHTLTIDIFQTGVSVPSPGQTVSTFSVNNLIGSGAIGPTTETTFFGGTTSTLGTMLATASFPVGTIVAEDGPTTVLAGAGFSSDAHQYVIPFAAFAGSQSANDTIQLTTGVIPEPSTWAMIAIGFAGLAWVGFLRSSRGKSLTLA